VNNRSLTRGDLGVGIAAAVLLICSFLDLCKVENNSWNGWSSDFYPVLPSFFLSGVIGGGLILGARFLPDERKLLGMRLDQWGTVLAVSSAWAGLWVVIGNGPFGMDLAVGAILGFFAALVLAGLAVATPLVPALRLPLTGGAGAGQPGGQPFGGQPGYGYPGAQPGQPGQPYAAQQPAAQQQPAAGQSAPAGGASDPNFQPFWFAVPAARPLYSEDGSQTPVAELAPGTWYLAVEQRGQALVAQTQDGRRGVLQDTSGIQRG
jgi:hypothetical protein